MISVGEILMHLKEGGYVFQCDDDPARIVVGFCQLSNLKSHSIAWAKSKKDIEKAVFTGVEDILLVTKETSIALPKGTHLLICSQPKAIFFSIIETFFSKKAPATISKCACIETNRIGKSVSIGHFSYINKEVVIADDVTIGQHVSIECPAYIGTGTNIASGVVIGTDGYGYYEDVQGIQHKVPHMGGVQIGAFVDIGANTCIDRGTIGDTVIEDFVKIDNLCHIAHNVHIGKHAMVIALSLLGGSSTLHESAYIAPGVMVMNQLTIGKNSLIGMGSVVTKDVPANRVVIGVPAKVIRKND